MDRKPSMFAAVVVTLAVPSVFGQGLQNQTPARFPADPLPSPELIAWSYLQKPRPVPQPLPPPDKNAPRPDQQTPKAPGSQTQQQTFTGRIIRDGNKYVLKIANNTTYQLDAQENARQYVDKEVKVVGMLDADANMIHVDTIELLS